MIKSLSKLSRFSQFFEHFNVDAVVRLSCPVLLSRRDIHVTSKEFKEIRGLSDKLSKLQTKKDLALDGELTIGAGSLHAAEDCLPNNQTINRLFDGVPYNDLHIVNIKTTPNNTIMNATTAEGVPLVLRSAGVEGFKNARKGTNIAAQQTAITFGMQVIRTGIINVRVRIQGIGPGRMSSLKGLYMSGLNIVSITDDTRVTWCPRRPRKPRKL